VEQQSNFKVEYSQRLDLFLAERLNQTRSQSANLIKKGAVSVDGKITLKPGLKLKASQEIEIEFPQKECSVPMEIDFDVEIVYEDDSLMVINKPSGLTVHPAPSVKDATLVDWLKHKGIRLSTISGEERHGIVHRLDKGTSGVMVVAKTNEAHAALAKQLEDKSMGRYYLAVIAPPLKEEISIIDKPISRNPSNRIKMGIVQGGKEAKTAFLSLGLSKTQKEQLIACKLFTGRTHQIRVHLESVSRQIVGDGVYGANIAKVTAERILLHAYTIYFKHPITQKRVFFSAKFDKVFEGFLEKKFEMEKLNEKIIPEYIHNSFTDTWS